MREIEAKFEGDTPAVSESVLDITELAGFTVSERSETRQADHYYDTLDKALRNDGTSLRVRVRPNRMLMTYKGDRQAVQTDAGLQAISRQEEEVELSPAFAAAWQSGAPLQDVDSPIPLQLARAIVGDAELLPTAIIETERRTRIFTKEKNRIEVAVDRTRGTRGSDGRVVTFGEIEIELHEGDVDELKRFCDALVEAVPGLRVSEHTKLGRALD